MGSHEISGGCGVCIVRASFTGTGFGDTGEFVVGVCVVMGYKNTRRINKNALWCRMSCMWDLKARAYGGLAHFVANLITFKINTHLNSDYTWG